MSGGALVGGPFNKKEKFFKHNSNINEWIGLTNGFWALLFSVNDWSTRWAFYEMDL